MSVKFAFSPDGIRIAYEIVGQGPALMLLHGDGSSRQEWQAEGYIQRLQDKFTLIAVDMRGHGESDKPIDPLFYSTEKLGQDFLAVADASGVDRFILWGYSLGGNAGRYLAVRSDRVAQIVMVGNPLGPGVSGEFRQLAIGLRARWEPVLKAHPGSFDPNLLSKADQEELQQLSFPGQLLPGMLALSTAMLDWPVVELADFSCPTLWVIGSENRVAMQSYQMAQPTLKDSWVGVAVFEGFNHPQEADEIDQVLPIILTFLGA